MKNVQRLQNARLEVGEPEVVEALHLGTDVRAAFRIRLSFWFAAHQELRRYDRLEGPKTALGLGAEALRDLWEAIT